MNDKKKIYCLSLQGGGILGILQAIIIQEIEKITDMRAWELFDLLAGTSTGSLIIAGLTLNKNFGKENVIPPLSGADLVELYRKESKNIFKEYPLIKIRTLGYTLAQKYLDKDINGVIDNYFYNYKYGRSYQKSLITSVDFSNVKLKVFKSWEADDGNYKVSDILKSSPKASYYFNPNNFQELNGNGIPTGKWLNLSDGGFSVNNPSMCVLSETNHLFPNDEIHIFSIGCADKREGYSYNKMKKWNTAQLGMNLPNMFIGAQESATEYMVKSFIGDRYKSIKFPIPSHLQALDGKDNIEELIVIAEQWIENNQEYLKSICEELVENCQKR